MKNYMNEITIIGLILTSASFVITILVLPDQYTIWGYIIALFTLITVISHISYSIWKLKKEKNLMVKVFENRDDMLQEWSYKDIIVNSGKFLYILGGTLRDFINDEHLGYIKKYLSNEETICRVLLQNPSSQGSFLRANEEGRVPSVYSDIYLSLEHLLKYQLELPSEYRKRFEIKKYSNVPTTSMFITENKIAYTYYQYETRSSKSLWYILSSVKNNKSIELKLKDQFERIWEDSKDLKELDNFVILFEGLPGVGKTHTANYLYSHIANSHLISSKDIRIEFGLTDIFSEEQKITVYDIILGNVSELLCKGERKIIIDGNYLLNKQRDKLFTHLKKMKVDIYYFLIEANQNEILNRINEKIISDQLYKDLKFDSNNVINKVNNAHQKLSHIESELIDSKFFYNTSEKRITYEAKNYVVKYFSEHIKSILINEP